MPITDILHGETLLGCVPCDGRCVLSPIVVLGQNLDLNDLMAISPSVVHVDAGLEWSHIRSFTGMLAASMRMSG